MGVGKKTLAMPGVKVRRTRGLKEVVRVIVIVVIYNRKYILYCYNQSAYRKGSQIESEGQQGQALQGHKSMQAA